MRPLSASVRASLMASARQYHADLAGSPAEEYLTQRGIDRATAEKFRIGYVRVPITAEDERYQGRLSIPSLGPGDVPYSLRYRRIEEDDSPKYMGAAGVETRLFNVRAIADAPDTISITEGEMDAITLEACGLRAIGVTGANAWKPYYQRLFAGFSTVYVWGDSDKAGQEFIRKVCEDILSAVPVRIGASSGVNDVNELFVTHGQQAVLDTLEAKNG